MKLGYWAALDGDDAAAPSVMLGATTPVEAAGNFAQSLIETSKGDWTEGTIRVWDKAQGPEGASLFDVTARFVPCDDDEIECELEIIERDPA